MENKPATTEKGRYRLRYRGTYCLNCANPLDLSDKFCPNCSQANSTKKLSLKDFFDEFFANYISYDSKLLKTLSALLLKPGLITREYINGKRVSYTNPFRFLLSLAIIYFLMLNVGSDFATWDDFANDSESGAINFNWNDSNIGFVDETERQEVVKTLDSIQLLNRINLEIQKKDSLMLSNPKKYYNALGENSSMSRYYHKIELFLTLIRKGRLIDVEQLVEKYKIPDSSENRFLFAISKSLLKVKNRPGSFISSLISKLPFAVFFFLPVFASFIWLAYIRKKYDYTDHLIFSFHNTSLLFILLIISYLIDSIFETNSNWVFLTIFSIYLFWAMKKFYGQNVFKTIVKYLFINTIFFILALFSTLILFAGNIFTY